MVPFGIARSLSGVLLLSVASLFWVGCDGGAAEPERGAIRGQVFAATDAGRVPLAGAEVTASALLLGAPAPAPTVSGTEGAFEFTSVEPGGYVLAVNREGYESAFEIVEVHSEDVVELEVTLQAVPSAP